MIWQLRGSAAFDSAIEYILSYIKYITFNGKPEILLFVLPILPPTQKKEKRKSNNHLLK